jgi:hypothetical protein
MHVSFKIHYRNNLIDKKYFYLILRLPSWDDRNCSYGHQLYPSDKWSGFVCTNVNVCIVLACRMSAELNNVSVKACLKLMKHTLFLWIFITTSGCDTIQQGSNFMM